MTKTIHNGVQGGERGLSEAEWSIARNLWMTRRRRIRVPMSVWCGTIPPGSTRGMTQYGQRKQHAPRKAVVP